MKVTVLGAGAWGTAVARLLHQGGLQTVLWGHDPAHVDEMRGTGRNERYLPGVALAGEIQLQNDLNSVLDADFMVVAVPSKAFRDVTRVLKDFPGIVVSLTKGIEYDTGLTMCGVLAENAPKARHAALSGPTFAIEVAQGIPTAIVAGSKDLAAAEDVQKVFSSPTFRIYTTSDILGVELGGALKNVIAIASGVADGLGFGDNSKAALVTRAIAEIRRLGVACGAQADTFTGLSGLGDLMVTCFSKHSRNRAFGERCGRGEKPADVAASMQAIAEGYPTARSAYKLARRHDVTTPIIDEVFAMLYEGKDVRHGVRDLMSRELKAED
ncbi:MAG TPA: NAD(P)H-dependent glycerol-3-phosphate dehydrogenase [Candidatus Polarisedimenticolia bacterium]|nr:NAD(P)H-dependent glycerol-3-phosphate dehydrogenase [Candidatus Polarisedimenticolia bacterium]